jgi:hypothetical protein
MTTTTPVDDEANATKGANHTNTRKTVTRSAKVATFPTLPKRRRCNRYERSGHGTLLQR